MAILGESDDFFMLNSSTGNYTVIRNSDWDNAMLQLVMDFKASQFTLSDTQTIIFIVLYVPIFILSLIGNFLVLLVILPNRRMWSVTNNFLVNLAVADLLVTLLCVPMTVASKVYRLWVYGDVLCKLTPYLQGVAVTASTFTITAMSMDRCLAILHPMKFRSLRTTKYVRLLLMFVWITALSLMAPLLFVYQTRTQELFDGFDFTKCSEMWNSLFQRRAYDFSLLFIVCIIPAQIVFVSYVLMGKRLWVTDSRLNGEAGDESKSVHSGSGGSYSEKSMDSVRANRRRIAKMCIVVSIVFVVCWTPYYTVNIYLDFTPDTGAGGIIYWWAILVGHLHCISNPILYCFMHKTFRHCVLRYVPCYKGLTRLPSGYGTGAFINNQNSRMMASFRSSGKSSLLRKDRLQRLSSNTSSGRSRKSVKNEHSPKIERAGEIDECGHSKNEEATPKKVQLIFSKFRDQALCRNRPDSFRIIEIPDAIKEESRHYSPTE